MTRFIRQIESSDVPHPQGYGRITRFTIDVDTDAVGRYIYEAHDSKPWPIALIIEMAEQLTEYARQENMVATFAKRRTES